MKTMDVRQDETPAASEVGSGRHDNHEGLIASAESISVGDFRRPEDAGLRILDIQLAAVRAAEGVASTLVRYFGLSLLIALTGGVAVILAVRFSGTESAGALVDDYLSLLQAVGTFSATVFGPILGFILGHYFGKQARNG